MPSIIYAPHGVTIIHVHRDVYNLIAIWQSDAKAFDLQADNAMIAERPALRQQARDLRAKAFELAMLDNQPREEE